MVVSLMVRMLYPSARGFTRNAQAVTSTRHLIVGDTTNSQESLSTVGIEMGSTTTSGKQNSPNQNNNENNGLFEPAMLPKHRPFSAMSLLTSLASDIDLVSDWCFWKESMDREREYRQEQIEERGEEAMGEFLIPPILLRITLVVCILGTICWLVLATDGRIMAPIVRRFGYDKLSMGHMLFLAVVFEDIPQVIMTFLIEDYYEEDSSLSSVAIINLTSSIYDTLIKLAEAYDERHDVVETGDWCKESLWAHHQVVSKIVCLPSHPDGPVVMDNRPVMGPASQYLQQEQQQEQQQQKQNQPKLSPKLRRPTLKRQGTSSLFENALLPIAPVPVPRLRFLTCSMDKTIRLWDTCSSRKGHRREKCVHVYRAHSDGVTCLVLLGRAPAAEALSQSYSSTTTTFHSEKDERLEEELQTTFFVAGSVNGIAKLWNLKGDCIRSFISGSGITDMATVEAGSSFVSSHRDASARLWEAWSGVCMGIFKGHSAAATCVTSMMDSHTFVTGSRDGKLNVWSTVEALEAFRSSSLYTTGSFTLGNSNDRDVYQVPSPGSSQDDPIYFQSTSQQEFATPSEIVCVTCLEQRSAFISGSSDGLAHLWSLTSGCCLRVFAGHVGPVTSLAVVDQVTILTGSGDCTVKVWDVMSGACLRTYVDHSDYVSSIAVAQDGFTFITASADRTVKIWVITSVLPEEPDTAIREVLANTLHA